MSKIIQFTDMERSIHGFAGRVRFNGYLDAARKTHRLKAFESDFHSINVTHWLGSLLRLARSTCFLRIIIV